ncbi:Transcription initiation factor TFIID subunit 12b [Nymphaea thermarum]|nr:Transcription initiation factor TFIID subunit 12b [Nymphaea thermarum]
MDESTPSNSSLNPPLIPAGGTTGTGAGTATTASPASTMENTAQQQQQMPINQGQLLLAQVQLSGTPSEPTQHQQQMLPSQAFQVQQGLASQQAAGAHLQRTSSAMSRINPAQYSMRPAIYAQQQAMGMNFSPHIQQQAGGTLSRSALISQAGHLPMLPGQATQFTNLQSQLLSQPRQKALMQGSQFQSSNPSGQQLQGMHPIGMMGSLGLSSQLRPNGSLAYSQQRIGHGQIRPQQLPQQQSLTSPQKLQAQALARPRSLASLNSQLSGLAQNAQPTMMQNSLSQQQWMKQIQSPISTSGSPSYHLNQQQRQALLQQQFSASQSSQKQPVTLNQQAVSQLVHQHQATQQQALHHKQQAMQQQQPSPRTSGLAIQNSGNLIGSQPGTPASGMTTGGSASQGGETTTQLLGKRKIQDLVSQVLHDIHD